jgi:hypothetical protein
VFRSSIQGAVGRDSTECQLAKGVWCYFQSFKCLGCTWFTYLVHLSWTYSIESTLYLFGSWCHLQNQLHLRQVLHQSFNNSSANQTWPLSDVHQSRCLLHITLEQQPQLCVIAQTEKQINLQWERKPGILDMFRKWNLLTCSIFCILYAPAHLSFCPISLHSSSFGITQIHAFFTGSKNWLGWRFLPFFLMAQSLST